jgi:drug/metabolite transporter (DMT)-like permease
LVITEYTGLLSAVLIGFAFCSETPRPMVYAGGALVVLGCLIVARGEQLRPSASASETP